MGFRPHHAKIVAGWYDYRQSRLLVPQFDEMVFSVFTPENSIPEAQESIIFPLDRGMAICRIVCQPEDIGAWWLGGADAFPFVTKVTNLRHFFIPWHYSMSSGDAAGL